MTPLPQAAYSAAPSIENCSLIFSHSVLVPCFPLSLTGRMSVAVFILNFNGRPLLAQCLPTVRRAAIHDMRPGRVPDGPRAVARLALRGDGGVEDEPVGGWHVLVIGEVEQVVNGGRAVRSDA